MTIPKTFKTIGEYLRLLKLTKPEYQKLFQENKTLTDKLNLVQKEKKEKITNKRQYKEGSESEEEEEDEPAEVESEPEETAEEKVKKPKTIIVIKISR